MSHYNKLLARLQARLYRHCCHDYMRCHETRPVFTATLRGVHTNAQHSVNTTAQLSVNTTAHRSVHTSTAPLIGGKMRKQSKDQLVEELHEGLFERRSTKKLEFDMIPIEESGDVTSTRDDVKSATGDVTSATDDQLVSDKFNGIPASEGPLDTDSVGADISSASERVSCADNLGLADGATLKAAADESPAPDNIMGDLDSLFSGEHLPEPVVEEQAGIVESLGSVDYKVYYNPLEGEPYEMPEFALGKRNDDDVVTLQQLVQFIRDFRCFGTEVIQVKKGMFVEHVIVTSTHNSKHLKDTGWEFYKMCRNDYHMTSTTPNWRKQGRTGWVMYDVGHTLVHFMMPAQRARFNLESLWMDLDEEEEQQFTEEELYTADLLEGIFPDEDFSKLGKPFELVDTDKGR